MISFQNILQLQPYHIDALMQLSEVFRMSEDVQMAAELIGNLPYQCRQAWANSVEPAQTTPSDQGLHCLLFHFHYCMRLVTRKPVFGVCDHVRLKPASSATETS